jgi:hypothetical protein
LLPGAHKKPRPSPRSIRVEKVGRGCEQNDKHCNRELGFFAIAVEKFFSFRADWHQDDRAKPLIRQYQTALASVLQSHPELLGCVAHCAHCGIRFFTHPRNVGRRDLRCPFGCRRHHRRQQSRQRSTAYYRTAAGKRKKKRLNGRRHQPPTPQTSPPNAPASDAPPIELRLEGVVLDESSLAESPMLPYVRMVVSLIEGVEFSCREVLYLLRQAMRQHSIGARRRIDYVLGFLNEHPP